MNNLNSPPHAALTPPLRREGSWLPLGFSNAPNLQHRLLAQLPPQPAAPFALAASPFDRSAPHPSKGRGLWQGGRGVISAFNSHFVWIFPKKHLSLLQQRPTESNAV